MITNLEKPTEVTTLATDSATNYEPGKTISKTPFWNRHFRARIYLRTSNTTVYPNSDGSNQQQINASIPKTADLPSIDVSDLRCTFQAQHYALNYPNICNLTIYNLNASTENTVIEEGYRLILEAGYCPDGNPKHGNFGQIFDGEILMCTRSRLNGTEMVLNILAMDGAQFYSYGYCNFSLAKGQSMRDVVKNIANKASTPIFLGYATPALDSKKLSKGYSAHGKPSETLNDIARSINGTWFIEGGKLYVVAYSDSAAKLPLGKQAVVLTPETGLLGNPQQQGQGVQARSLLNPAIQLYGLVNIPNVYITEQMVTVGSYSQGISMKYPLDSHALYRVISVNHNGDTRGNAWYSDIVTVTQSGAIPETLTLN